MSETTVALDDILTYWAERLKVARTEDERTIAWGFINSYLDARSRAARYTPVP